MNDNNPLRQTFMEQTCKKCLDFFVKSLSLTKSNFPILDSTYTLWRKYAFFTITEGTESSERQSIIKAFHDISEKQFLPQFISRIKIETSSYCRGLKKIQQNLQQNLQQQTKMPKKEQELYQILFEIGQTVWNQQLYLELIQDLIRLPYLEVIPFKSKIMPRQQYQTNYIFEKKQKVGYFKKLVEKQKNNLITKLLNSLTQTVFSRAFVTKITTLVGTFDPFMMGASFGLSTFMSYCGKKQQDHNFELQFKGALEFYKKKVEKLAQIYNKCCQLVQQIVHMGETQGESPKKKKLKQVFLTVFQEEWLQIEVEKEEDDWEVVKIEEKQNYQELFQSIIN